MDVERIKHVGIAAAYNAGNVILDYFKKGFEVRKKGGIDLVTEADIASEKIIINIIRKQFPDHGILAEESGESQSDSPVQWYIDPLDGTTNFTHRLPIFCVSVACAVEEKIIFGAVYNPVSEEFFTALEGKGAELNGQPIQVSQTPNFNDSLLVTGFPYNLHEIIDSLMCRFSNCLGSAQGIRRLGSAALDLCFIACGRFDGFWEQNLKAWDTAAGVIIAREAGARVTNFSNEYFTVDQKEILATNGKIHDQIVSLLKISADNRY
jgi:myo-inositol-1(or 4)-monophosphatase